MIVDIRIMTDANALQIIKGLSSYLLFRICENLRKRYPNRHFWNEGYFYDGVGSSGFARSYEYIKNQEEYHSVRFEDAKPFRAVEDVTYIFCYSEILFLSRFKTNPVICLKLAIDNLQSSS